LNLLVEILLLTLALDLEESFILDIHLNNSEMRLIVVGQILREEQQFKL
jgi:hypothetical protein